MAERHARVCGAAYDAFISKYLQTASSLFPRALLHFEDFGPGNARRILVTYRVWQTGSGTQSNMNVNEVISNRSRRPGRDLRG